MISWMDEEASDGRKRSSGGGLRAGACKAEWSAEAGCSSIRKSRSRDPHGKRKETITVRKVRVKER